MINSKKIKVEINIPAFDELPNLNYLLPLVNKVIRENDDFEFVCKIILRKNETFEVLNSLIIEGAIPIHREPNDSFGSAINTAIRSIDEDSDYVIFMDADGSHNPSRISELVGTIVSCRAHVVIASRYVNGGFTENNLILRILSRSLNLVYSFVLGIKCRDVSTNFKIYEAGVLRGLELKCKNFDVIEELLFLINARLDNKILLMEIPDHFEIRKFGESKRRLGPFIVTYILTLIKLRLRIIRENTCLRR